MTRTISLRLRHVAPAMSFGSLITLTSAVASAGAGVWTTNGPTGAQSYGAVVVDPHVPGTVYAATQTGVAKSTDNGQTWLPTGLVAPGARPVAASSGNVYATSVAVNNSLPPWDQTSTLYRSVDGGAHWEALQSFLGNTDIVIDPVTSSVLYRVSLLVSPIGNIESPLIATAGLARSSDGGQTWSDIDLQAIGTYEITALAIDPKNTATLYLAHTLEYPETPTSPGEVFKSTDAGMTWTLLTNSLGSVVSLVVDPVTSNTMYAATPSGIFKSVDGGHTFQLINASLTGDSQLVAMVIDPTHPARLYGATRLHGVVASTDSGVDWTPLNNGLSGASLAMGSLAIDETGMYLHVTAMAPGVFDYQIVRDPEVLTLNASHSFSITVTATDQRTARTGSGLAAAMNDLWGYFSIPAITGNSSNPEVFVKMLDGTALNGSFWFFYGGLTDLEYMLTVTEDATGLTKTYTKPAGSECGGSDTQAFTP